MKINMPNFFDKLKKGMKTDVKNYYQEEEKPEQKEEIDKEELEKEISEDEYESEIKSVGVKDFVLQEVEKKPKKTAPKPKKAVKLNPEEITLKQDFQKWAETEPSGQLVIDLCETPSEIIIQSAIAGINPDNLDISIENDMVSIKGRRSRSFKEEGANYLISECYWGNFIREIILPSEVDAGNSDASMKNGVLTIRMPKVEKEKKKISVR